MKICNPTVTNCYRVTPTAASRLARIHWIMNTPTQKKSLLQHNNVAKRWCKWRRGGLSWRTVASAGTEEKGHFSQSCVVPGWQSWGLLGLFPFNLENLADKHFSHRAPWKSAAPGNCGSTCRVPHDHHEVGCWLTQRRSDWASEAYEAYKLCTGWV